MPPPRIFDLFKRAKAAQVISQQQPAVATTSSIAAEPLATKETKLSIFTVIDKDAKKALSAVEVAFKDLWKEEPKAEAIAVQIITETAPEIVAIAAVIGGTADATAANAIISQVKTGLATVQAALTAANVGSATSATTVLQAVVTKLGSLLTLAGVKNAANFATIEKDVNEIIAGLQILIAAIA